MNKETTKEIDRAIGQRIKFARNMNGVSQKRLAKELGLSFQQIQKYETATNRVSASKLKLIATFLDLPISFFYDEAISPALRADARYYKIARALSLIENKQIRSNIARIIELHTEKGSIQ